MKNETEEKTFLQIIKAHLCVVIAAGIFCAVMISCKESFQSTDVKETKKAKVSVNHGYHDSIRKST